MAKIHPSQKGLVYLSHTEIDDTALQGLTGGNAATLDETYKDIPNGFLAKRFRMWYTWDQDADDLHVLLYLNAPGANEAETELALEQTMADPKDSTNWGQKQIGQRVINSTLFSIANENFAPDSTRSYSGYSGWLYVGAKGGGIPYPNNTGGIGGPEVHAYNYDADTILGTTLISYVYQIEGVWLED